jgi:hypothetical protein
MNLTAFNFIFNGIKIRGIAQAYVNILPWQELIKILCCRRKYL